MQFPEKAIGLMALVHNGGHFATVVACRQRNVQAYTTNAQDS
jgi:hypothetical protein